MTRERFADDPHRPAYHFLPPANWMNDPNGLAQWRGEYHIFYQHNPDSAVWGPMYWGHAVSRDLVHWEDLPIALAPTPGSPDQDGCWSGVVVDDGGVPTIVYSGNAAGRQLPCLATSADDLRTWVKEPANPVIAAPPEGIDPHHFRDHVVWREGEVWHQLIGAGKVGGAGGAALLYRSPDLRAWEYLGPILEGDTAETGEIWECPDLIRLGDWVFLVLSPIPLRRAIYMAGAFDGRRFTPVRRGELDAGGHCYAPQSFVDEQGRRILIGWLWEGRSQEAQVAAGWAGVMTLPRVLSASPDGRLLSEPAPELAQLRQRPRSFADVPLHDGQTVHLEDAAGDSVELDLRIDPADASVLTVAVRRSPDGAEETLVVYDVAAGRLWIDRSHASLDPTTQSEPHGVAWAHGADRAVQLRIFVDRSVVEVYAEGEVLATRTYPSRADSLGVAISASGGDARLAQGTIWDMRAIW